MATTESTAVKLRVAHVKISNILGIEELEFAPGGYCEVTGGNGSGKTSTIEALRAALRGGHDATLLRNGAEKGEIVLVLDDGTQIKKSVTAKDTNVVVLRDEKKVQRPAEAIKALHDVLSVNPVEFLRVPEKQRVDVLLQTMPIAVDRAWVMDQAKVSIDDKASPLAKLDGLDLVEAAKKVIFDERTGVNRAARDKEGAINQLRATLPAEVPDAPPTDASLLAKLDEIDSTRDKEIQRISDKLGGLKSVSDEKVAALRAEIASIQETVRQRIAEIEQVAAAEVEAKRKAIQAEQEAFTVTNQNAEGAKSKARAAHAQARAGVEAEVKNIEEAQKQHARFEQTKQNIARMDGELHELKVESRQHTEALEALDAYKAELLAALPIPGLEVIEGQILRYGVPFDRLNTAQQVEIAVEIAKLRAGELGLICVDGLELLDEAHYEAFRESAAQSGLQMIVSRVGDGELKIQAAGGV